MVSEKLLNKIKKELDEAQKIQNDKWRESLDLPNDEYQEFLKPYVERAMALSRIYRYLRNTYELKELPDYGDVMSMEHFIECCVSGCFIDYDGCGYYVKDDKETDIEIRPSDVTSGCFRTDFDKMIWFNK